MANPWFESVIEARRRAKRRLPRSVYMALVAGSERGLTLRDNEEAFAELGFGPNVTDHPKDRDLSTTVMGQEVSMPIVISPTGVQAVHPDGELAVARAAASRGAAMGLGGFGSKAMEEVIPENPGKTFFQTYWTGSKDAMLHRVERARAAGATGLIVTLDWSFGYGRDWGSPEIPEEMNLRTIIKHAPEVVLGGKFGYLKDYAKTLRPPELSVPNMQLPGEKAPGFFDAYSEWNQTPAATWEDVAWLREQWGGPFMVKGITRVNDAQAAVQTGATAISVSNHGGNNLDGTPGAIRLLPAIADAVGDQVEVYMDGGIRRGSDVFKALALGARAVLVGRAYLWGVAANGQAGVENVLDILRDGLSSAMYGTGCRTLADITREHLLIPEDFARILGTDEGNLIGRPKLDPEHS